MKHIKILGQYLNPLGDTHETAGPWLFKKVLKMVPTCFAQVDSINIKEPNELISILCKKIKCWNFQKSTQKRKWKN